MEDLNKQQLVLLALLVSFVTSIATGIVTVTLVDQAPKGVTQTINQIVERTIEKVVPAENKATVVTITKEVRVDVPVPVEEALSSAVERVSQSVVRLMSTESADVLELGIVLDKDGIIGADKTVLGVGTTFTALFSNGKKATTTVIDFRGEHDVVYLKIDPSAKVSFVPVSYTTDQTKIGQIVFSLGGDERNILARGVVSGIEGSTTAATIETDIKTGSTFVGSGLWSSGGALIGMRLSSEKGSGDFISIGAVKADLAALKIVMGTVASTTKSAL
jgi:S1-C subfamily serine protease